MRTNWCYLQNSLRLQHIPHSWSHSWVFKAPTYFKYLLLHLCGFPLFLCWCYVYFRPSGNPFPTLFIVGLQQAWNYSCQLSLISLLRQFILQTKAPMENVEAIHDSNRFNSIITDNLIQFYFSVHLVIIVLIVYILFYLMFNFIFNFPMWQ